MRFGRDVLPILAENCFACHGLAERGVRFIQLFHPDWDHHKQLTSWCTARCRDTDQPTAALLIDLERRGLLEDTLVIWGGGVKPGMTFGSTDDFSYNVVENGLHVRDLHAAVLHLPGIDHQRLTYRFSGLDFRLTGVEPSRIVTEILA